MNRNIQELLSKRFLLRRRDAHFNKTIFPCLSTSFPKKKANLSDLVGLYVDMFMQLISKERRHDFPINININ